MEDIAHTDRGMFMLLTKKRMIPNLFGVDGMILRELGMKVGLRLVCAVTGL